MAMTFFIFPKKSELLAVLVFTAFAASLVGSERINMIAFFLFSYYVIAWRKTSNLFVLLLMVYFAIKGVFFVIDVFTYGTGFGIRE